MNFYATIGVCASVVMAVPAAAQDLHKEGPPSSRLMQEIGRTAPEGTFYLTRDQQSEVADYSRNRDFSLCVQPRNATANPIPGENANVPLQVEWKRMGNTNEMQTTVYPGNCLSFDAAHVTIKPARDLPTGMLLKGRIRTAGNFYPEEPYYDQTAASYYPAYDRQANSQPGGDRRNYAQDNTNASKTPGNTVRE